MSERSVASGPAPGPEHRALDVFVGTWNTQGLIEAGPSGPASRLEAVDTYEWLPGGFFLLHHVDGSLGDQPIQTLEIIGYDASNRSYVTRSYDNQGNSNSYRANLRAGWWTILGESERFTGVFSDDGTTLTGLWEQSADGASWVSWMTIKLTRVAS